MNSLRIGFVIDDNLDSTAGVQQFTLTLGRELARRGHHVKYLTSETSTSNPESAHIYSLAKLVHARMNGNTVGTPLPASKNKIQAVLEAENFDVLHVTTPYSPLLAGRIIMQTSAALVGTFHIAVDTPTAGIGAHVLSRLQFRSLAKFDYWTAVSQAAADFALQYYRITVAAITPNPIELKKFVVRDSRTDDSSKFTVAFLGRLVERKGAQHLLQALTYLSPEDQAHMQVIIGGGGPMKKQLETFVDDHGLSAFVQFAGFVPEEDKAAFLAAADICAFPSTGGECFGISLLEGMAVGSSVVIGGDNQGYRTVLGKSHGVLLDVRNHEAFAAKLSQLMHDAPLRQKIIAWQSDEVKQYDVAVIATQMEHVYSRAIANKQLKSDTLKA